MKKNRARTKPVEPAGVVLSPAEVARLLDKVRSLSESGDTPEWQAFHRLLVNRTATIVAPVGLLTESALTGFWYGLLMNGCLPALRMPTNGDRLSIQGIDRVFEVQLPLMTALLMAQEIEGYQLTIRSAPIKSLLAA